MGFATLLRSMIQTVTDLSVSIMLIALRREAHTIKNRARGMTTGIAQMETKDDLIVSRPLSGC